MLIKNLFNINNKGFTLIELGLVILVSSIIMSAAVPVWMQKRMQTGVEKTAAEMSNIIAASKSYYMNAYYNPEDNFPMYARWPENFNELKSGRYLSQDFPEQNPFLRDYIIEANSEYSSSYGPYNAMFSVKTEVPDEDSARYLASVVPGGRVINGTTVVSDVHIPGSAPSLDNLLHRDAGSTDEHRTMHANVIMSTSEDARIIDQDHPYNSNIANAINQHAGYDLNLDEESHLEDLRVYSEIFVGKSTDKDIRIFYQRDTFSSTEKPAYTPGGGRYNPDLAVFETNAGRFLFTNDDPNHETAGFIESAKGLFGSSRNRMSWYLNDSEYPYSDGQVWFKNNLFENHVLAGHLGRIQDIRGGAQGTSFGHFIETVGGRNKNEDYFAYVLPYGTVFVGATAYPTSDGKALVGAFHPGQGEDIIDIKRGLIYQIAIVENGAKIVKPKCPWGSQPELFTAISNFSEGKKGIDFPISDFRTNIKNVACPGGIGGCWEVQIEPSRAIFSGTPLIAGPIDNETGVPQLFGGELWMTELNLDVDNLDIILDLLKITSQGQNVMDAEMEGGHSTYTVLAISACR
jgi:prepilin-type N-terminal cleavage/methylation domain-containing protein